MEKIMIFGLVIWFGLMMTDTSRSSRNDPQQLKAAGVNDNARVNQKQQQAVYTVNATDKPLKSHEHPVFWQRTE